MKHPFLTLSLLILLASCNDDTHEEIPEGISAPPQQIILQQPEDVKQYPFDSAWYKPFLK